MNILLSDKLISGTIQAHVDGWVSIGAGLEVLLPTDAEDGDSWELSITPYTTPTFLGNSQISDTIAISSETQLLSLIQGNLVYTENTTDSSFSYPDKPSKPTPNHRSPIIETLFNHIFLARGRTIWWTDLDNYWNWYPSPESEADFRTIEWEKNDITCLVKVNDVLFAHFPTMVYSIEYVGKPTIVHIKALINGCGAVTQNAVCVNQSTMFFLGLDNFYAWSTQTGLIPIGNKIWERFVKSVPSFQSIWCYVDQLHNEICWVAENVMWVYNMTGELWTKYSANFIQDHITAPWFPPHQILNSTSSETLLNIDKVYPIGVENLYLLSDGVYRDQKEGDELSRCLDMDAPFLESDDITYGDIHFHKRVDLVLLDANYDFPWRGVRVSVSGRHYISDPMVWQEIGVWTKERFPKQLDFKTVAGRVLKYRFELVSDLDLPARLCGGVLLDGKRPSVWDGLSSLDGSIKLLPRDFDLLDGQLALSDMGVMKLNWFNLAAWGERVDLPQVITGPDK